MEKKKVLGKIIPAVLVLVLALLLVITISSCSKGKKTPTGAIEDKKDYLKIDIADDKDYSVSKLEFYNNLRYVGYDVFEDALYGAVLSDIVTDIKKDIEDNSGDLSNAKYFNKFKYIIDAEVYGSSDEEAIADLKDEDKEKKEKTYINTLKKAGYTVDSSNSIYQKASFEYQTIKLAKREYARGVLLEEIDDEEGENKVSESKIKDYFTKKVVTREDFSALLILFTSQSEIEDALKQLNLKYISDKLYRVDPDKATYADDANRKFSEYEEYYKDFDNSKSEVAALSENEILFEFCRVYNYTYPYRKSISMVIDGVDYLDQTLYPFNATENNYTQADYEKIKSYSLDDMIAQIKSQDTGDLNTGVRVNFDYDTIDEIDSTLKTALYTTYMVDSDTKSRYNTPSSTFARGNYLTFKLTDANEVTYKSVKTLVSLLDAIENNADAKVINTLVENIKEDYYDRIKGMGIFQDNEKVKAWAENYAKTVTSYGLTGARAILASTSDREDENSIWSKVFEEMLTDEYINEKLKEHLDDDCKITIYDSLFEVQFAQNYDFYKAGNNKSKTNVLKVKVNDKEVVVTAEELFEALEKKHGAGVASNLLLNQIVKEKYYSKITDAKKKEYEKEYENILTYFAQGQSSDYGYNPSIGQKAFVNLYFRADNKKDAIFNMWVAVELQNILVYDNPLDINSSMFDYFQTLTAVESANYVNLEFNQLYVYTDDDEDGKEDDWTTVDNTNERKKEVMELAAELINIINERAKNEYSNSDRDGAYNSLHSKYQAASRISNIGHAGTDPIPTDGFKTTSEQDAYYFSKYKAKGLYVAISVEKAINSLDSLRELKDENYEKQVQEMYKYMIATHGDKDLTVDQTFARTITADDTYTNLDEVTKDNIFVFEKGFATFYVLNTKKAPTFIFETKDNADTSTGSKVYPYSVNEDDPFPVDEDGKPLDNSGMEDTLYNSNEEVSKNQLIVYVRESLEGVESLSSDVIDAFTAYFEGNVMKKYSSTDFRYYIAYQLIKQYAADGKLTIDEELDNKMQYFVNSTLESLFDFEENAFTAKWYEIFK